MLFQAFFKHLICLTICRVVVDAQSTLLIKTISLLNSVVTTADYVNFLDKYTGEEVNAAFANYPLISELSEIQVLNDTVSNQRSYDMQIIVKAIDNYYFEFLEYTNTSKSYENVTLKNFIEKILNRDVGLRFQIDNFHKCMVAEENNLVAVTEKNIEAVQPYCIAQQSRQQYFYKMFLSLMGIESKAYQMLTYAYKMRSQFRKKNYASKQAKIRINATERISATVSFFKNILKKAHVQIWKCDPEKHEENISFVKLKNVFSWLFYNDDDFTTKKYNDCPNRCPVINKNNNKVASCHEHNDCTLKEQPVCDNLVECTKLGEHEQYDVCLTNNNNNNQDRRYDFIKTHDYNFWGSKNKNLCYNQYYGVGSRSKSVYVAVERPVTITCAACKCICGQQNGSDRYISLMPVMSDIESNFVVTGIKFVKENHTIHLQIQQGKLLPGGFVSNSSVDWKAIGENEYTNKSNAVKELIPNPRIFELNWFNKRGISLDDIEIPKNEVVTGVKFVVTEKDSEQYLTLAVFSTSFNASTGQLSAAKSNWHWNKQDSDNTNLLDLQNYDAPNVLGIENKPDGTSHQKTHFTPTGLTTNDSGQSTIPFLDIQSVTSNPPTPLSGLSLDIKRAGESGGFLMLKLKTYNVLEIL